MNVLSSQEPSTRIEDPPKIVGKVRPVEEEVILQPIILRVSNKHNVYSISKLKQQKLLTHKEFLSRYADHPKPVHVCFDEEVPSEDMMLQKSKLITAYNVGLGCWYIVIPDETC